jgi:hypothetical protein
MNAMLSDARVNAGRGPGMHLRAVDEALINNGWLILCGPDVAKRLTVAGAV